MTLSRARAQYPPPPHAIFLQSPHTRDRYDTHARSSSLRSPPVPPVPVPHSHANPKPARRFRRVLTGRALSLYALRSRCARPCASFHSRARNGSQKSFPRLPTFLPPASPAPCTAPAYPSQIPDTLPSSYQHPPASSRPAPASSFHSQFQSALLPVPI